MATIFSKIINGEIPCYKIAESDKYFAFLDISPISIGHTLVVPKCEVDYIFDLDDETLSGLHIFSKQIAQAIQKAMKCKRVAVSVIGMEVPHAHIHLVPINNESEMSFSNPKVKLTKNEFEEIASKIKAELK